MESERILAELAIMFIVAKLAGAAFERLHQPAVVGELIAGIVMGPYALHLISHTEVHAVLQELAAVVLLFNVGLDTPFSELRVVGGRALGVGTMGVILPFFAGTALISLSGYATADAFFMGTAMVATSVGVTARVLADLGRIREPESRVILGAAVVDDVLGLLVLAVVAGSVTGSLSIPSVVTLALLALGFVLLVGGLGPRIVRWGVPFLDRIGHVGVFTIALGLCLGLAAVADVAEPKVPRRRSRSSMSTLLQRSY